MSSHLPLWVDELDVAACAVVKIAIIAAAMTLAWAAVMSGSKRALVDAPPAARRCSRVVTVFCQPDVGPG